MLARGAFRCQACLPDPKSRNQTKRMCLPLNTSVCHLHHLNHLAARLPSLPALLFVLPCPLLVGANQRRCLLPRNTHRLCPRDHLIKQPGKIVTCLRSHKSRPRTLLVELALPLLLPLLVLPQ